MDTTDYPSLPNLARMHSRLAVDSRRVNDIVDAQLDAIERLFHATTAEDWQGIALASKMLSELTPEEVGPEVVLEAKLVYEEMTHSASEMRRPKHLGRLLDACRAVRSRARE
ncbi:hypothetical protein [Bythopirellula goksoeyrii]|uniref:Uncharacterized protein n=1 Tax=Bythopirellula goksoeyrii TaxID=1400387 RepID=A0A5B9QGV5_9BACT|nr:hypothetical protein [Bythopirellula goksoeyrii]QEG36832.1 hypothetical protein Pr1d_41680 [Bythopirellula goksoeyrii]